MQLSPAFICSLGLTSGHQFATSVGIQTEIVVPLISPARARAIPPLILILDL